MNHELRTPRLRLVPTREQYAERIFERMNDVRMWTYFPELRPKTLEDLRRMYRRWERNAPPESNEQWENWLCFRIEDDEPVGGQQATIVSVDTAYIAYSIYVDFQRHGYARESTQCVIDHLRADHGITRFVAEMNVRNEASWRLAEALGFKRIEVHIDVERGHGLIADEYVYELNLSAEV